MVLAVGIRPNGDVERLFGSEKPSARRRGRTSTRSTRTSAPRRRAFRASSSRAPSPVPGTSRSRSCTPERRPPRSRRTSSAGRRRRRHERAPRIAVYVCQCGGNIGDYVDVDRVIDAVKDSPGVCVARHAMFTCSDTNQQEMIEDVQGDQIDGMVVACCSPKLHTFTFRGVAERAGREPVPGHPGQHPRAVLVDAHRRSRRRHEEGDQARQRRHCACPARTGAGADRRRDHAARGGDRRRSRRDAGGHRPGRHRPGRLPDRAGAGPRGLGGRARRDVPAPRQRARARRADAR